MLHSSLSMGRWLCLIMYKGWDQLPFPMWYHQVPGVPVFTRLNQLRLISLSSTFHVFALEINRKQPPHYGYLLNYLPKTEQNYLQMWTPPGPGRDLDPGTVHVAVLLLCGFGRAGGQYRWLLWEADSVQQSQCQLGPKWTHQWPRLSPSEKIITTH